MMGRRGLLASLVGVAALAAIVGGFVMTGSPGDARRVRMDARRVSDLADLRQAVDVYRTRTGALPASLEALVATHVRQSVPVDPETGRPYDYAIRGDEAYELCGTFHRASGNGAAGAEDPFWSHGAGRQCFPLVARDLNREPH